MRRLLNLLLVGVAVLILLAGLAWVFRDQLAPWLGVNVDVMGDPMEYEASVTPVR